MTAKKLSTTLSTTFSTREAWLEAGVRELLPVFAKAGHDVPPCRVSCGFASTSGRSGTIGQCWSTKASEDGCGFIVPMLKQFLHYGPPICPQDRVEMEAIGEWEGL